MIFHEENNRRQAIAAMTSAISGVLAANLPSVYLYGSAVLDDFRLGWSDIDILVLTQTPISQEQAQKLVTLRQTLLSAEPKNVYYRSFEGGMLPLSAFLSKAPDRVVYWGTSGQRITDTYSFDSFCLWELLHNGQLLHGPELRDQMTPPTYASLREDVKKHCDSIRRYGHTTGRSLYSFGWLLDIARGLYTLRTGAVISKTAAGQWALEQGLCPDPGALETALLVRRDPLSHRDDPGVLDYAASITPAVQRFADVLESELDALPPQLTEK